MRHATSVGLQDSDDRPGGVEVFADAIDYTVVSSDPRYDGIAWPAAAREIRLLDDDPTTMTLTAPDDVAREADADDTARVVVTLGRALVAGEFIDARLIFGLGVLGEDFALSLVGKPAGVSLSGDRVRFTGRAGGGAVSATIAVAALADADSADKLLAVGLGTGPQTQPRISQALLDGGGVERSLHSTEVLRLIDTGTSHVARVSLGAATPASVAEGGTSEFAVTTAGYFHPELVRVTLLAGGSATPGEDYVLERWHVEPSTGEGRWYALGRHAGVGGGPDYWGLALYEKSQRLRVRVLSDGAREHDEAAVFTLGEYFVDGVLTGRVRIPGRTPRATAPDGVTLSGRATVAIPGPLGAPPALSVADASVAEAPGARLRFAVSLDAAAGAPVTVDYATRDGTARADADYTAASGSLTFAPGQTRKTVAVAVLDDAHDEGVETLELVLTNLRGATLGRAVATGTIVNTDPMPKAWLARFGRTVAEAALDGISRRIGAARNPGMQGTLGGQALPNAAFGDGGDGAGGDDGNGSAGAGRDAALAMAEVARRFGDSGPGAGQDRFDPHGPLDGRRGLAGESRSMTAREALLGTSFSLTGEADSAGGTLAFWGRAAQSRFDGRDEDLTVDGEVTTGLLGMDYARGRWTLGLALAQSAGEGGYRMEGADSGDGSGGPGSGSESRGGKVESTLTAAVPWAAWQASHRLTLWGAAGYGAGELTLTPEKETAKKTDIDWTMAAAGARAALLEPSGGGPKLDLLSDALWTRTASEKAPDLAPVSAQTTRLRLGLEAGWPVALEGGGSIEPTLSAGARHDGGDAETGFGVELGGGLAWSDPKLGLKLDVEGRTLLAHQDDGFRDRGFSAGVAYRADPDTRRGPSLNVRQDWGGQANGGLDTLFAPDPLQDRTGGEEKCRWTVEGAWGFPLFAGRFTGSPHAGLGLATGSRDYTIGWRLAPAAGPDAPEFSLGVKATRRESDSAQPEHTVGFEINARW